VSRLAFVASILVVATACGGSTTPEVATAPAGAMGWDLVGDGELTTIGSWDVIVPVGWTRGDEDRGAMLLTALRGPDGQQIVMAEGPSDVLDELVGTIPDGLDDVEVGAERIVPGADRYVRVDRPWVGTSPEGVVAVASARFASPEDDAELVVMLATPGEGAPTADLEEFLSFVSSYSATSAA
jgi:hypothetical protein